MDLTRGIEAARLGFRNVQRLSFVAREWLRRHIPASLLRALPSLARLGLASRGLLYIVIAALAMEAGGPNGAAGAISSLGTGVGQWLVLLMLIGLAGYGGWRLSDGLFGLDNPGWSRDAMFKRAGSLASAGIHFALANQCYEYLVDPNEWSGDLAAAAAAILSLSGLWLVLLVGSAAVFVAGITQVIKGAKSSFVIHLHPACRYAWLMWAGRLGHAARGLALLWLGYILLLGALNPQDARIGGIGLALATLSGPLTKLLAAGMAIFGVYCLAEARCRRIKPKPAQRPPSVDDERRQRT